MYEYMMYVQNYICIRRYMYMHMCYMRSHYPLNTRSNRRVFKQRLKN